MLKQVNSMTTVFYY